ncbi:MAG: DcaP family trimeric outer membrane transporter [Phycisphaerae bacterium]
MRTHRWRIVVGCAVVALGVLASAKGAEPQPSAAADAGTSPPAPADLLKRIERLEKALKAQADTTPDRLERENALLRKRIGELETEMHNLRKTLAQHRADANQPDPELEKLRAAIDAIRTDLRLSDNRRPVLSKLDLELYGYVKLDASYDTHEMATGNFALFVLPEGPRTRDNEFNLTARQTRLGLRIKGPDVEGVQTSGVVEGDFYGAGGASENRSTFRMRHAFLQLDWPEDRFSLLAGQTWDVISPLYPGTLNFTINWDAGNIGHRHPQVRLTKHVSLDAEQTVDLTLQGAVSRTIDRASITQTDTGADSGHPTVQGRAALTFPLVDGRPATVGAWGHWGREEFDVNAAGDHETLDSWSAGMDVAVPVADWLTLKAEIWTGEALDTYFGNIGQGLDAGRDALGGCGGWLAAALTPWEKWTFHIGAGVDALDDGSQAPGTRIQNRNVFGNVMYAINDQTTVGLEVSHWVTQYEERGTGDALRLQSSLIYKF